MTTDNDHPNSDPRMRVTLLDCTGKHHQYPARYAAALMIFTKRTRVEMSPGGLDEILAWPEHKIIDELKYMVETVPSSWEFCDYTFLIQNVTRAFTHQFVRTRTLSFAQQAMQVGDMTQGEGWQYLVGPTVAANPEAESQYRHVMGTIRVFYSKWFGQPGMKTEDVRGALPTNVLTGIVVKGNLRSFCDLIRKRVSPRNQGEFVDVLRLMKREMIAIHPWSHLFLEREADKVAADMYALLEEAVPDKANRTRMNKLIDQLLTNIGAGN